MRILGGATPWTAVALLCAALAVPCAADDPKAATPPKGARPGDEKGPGGFVKRKVEHDELTFYTANGGRLWYYLNLFYWVPEGTVTDGLWIREEVVETFEDLKRWPDNAAAPSPEPKRTVEYWKVGPTGRTIEIDNHKDFWLESEGWNAGRIVVTMTVRLGRLTERGKDGTWTEPKAPYVAESKSYRFLPGGARTPRGVENLRFEDRKDEPENVWRYEIPWDGAPGRFTKSQWKALPVPEIRLVRSAPVVPKDPVPEKPPVTTDTSR